MLFSVIIPMYNEEAVIASTLSTLTAHLEKEGERGGWEYEILCSDDGSSDGSRKTVETAAAALRLQRGRIAVVPSDQNHGKGSAVRLGMLAAKGDWRIFTDSDLAYGAEVMTAMLKEAVAKEDCGVLVGSRAIDGDGYAAYSPLRKLASRTYLKFLSMAAGFRYSDSQCGIKMFRQDAAEEIFSRMKTDGWAFDFEALMLADRLGFSVHEYPVRVLHQGQSKIRLFRDSIGMVREIGRIKKRMKNEGR